MPTGLDSLEEALAKIRSGKVNPVTKLSWEHDSAFITERAKSICPYPSKVFDVGCGCGDYLVSLARQGNECYGIDPLIKVSLNSAQRKAKEEDVDIHLCCGVGENIPFKDEAFDVILSISTLQHVANQIKYLLEVRRVLKMHGYLLVSVPHSFLPRGRQHNTILTMEFDLKSFKRILAAKGFVILEMECRKFVPVVFIVYFRYSLKFHRENLSMKLLEFSDNLANKMPFAASNLIALCKKVGGNK
jgi:ubiquinone/menaquinone biosynthesis C-methylase UbiE